MEITHTTHRKHLTTPDDGVEIVKIANRENSGEIDNGFFTDEFVATILHPSDTSAQLTRWIRNKKNSRYYPSDNCSKCIDLAFSVVKGDACADSSIKTT
jgi:hypothetical protein